MCNLEIKPWEADQDLKALYAKIKKTVVKDGLKWSEGRVELKMQLRGRRRVDGVGHPKFDFHTGIDEIVDAVKNNAEVVKFISNCGDDNLMFLLHPPRLKKALYFLDTDQSGEIDKEEWRVTRRPPHVFPSFVARL